MGQQVLQERQALFLVGPQAGQQPGRRQRGLWRSGCQRHRTLAHALVAVPAEWLADEGLTKGLIKARQGSGLFRPEAHPFTVAIAIQLAQHTGQQAQPFRRHHHVVAFAHRNAQRTTAHGKQRFQARHLRHAAEHVEQSRQQVDPPAIHLDAQLQVEPVGAATHGL